MNHGEGFSTLILTWLYKVSLQRFKKFLFQPSAVLDPVPSVPTYLYLPLVIVLNFSLDLEVISNRYLGKYPAGVHVNLDTSCLLNMDPLKTLTKLKKKR